MMMISSSLFNNEKYYCYHYCYYLAAFHCVSAWTTQDMTRCVATLL